MTEKHETNWLLSVAQMHEKFGVYDVVDNMDPEKLKAFLEFRLECLQEELDEIHDGIQEKNPEGVVDGLIDLVVFALGTLDLYGIRGHEAWAKVMEANMSKSVGIKKSTDGKPVRSNPFGLPDLVKPENFVAPSHDGNHGLVTKALS